MHFFLFLAASAVSVASAAPTPRSHSENHHGRHPCDLTAAHLPAINTTTTRANASLGLPSPHGKLLHVAVARGIQNYTCPPSTNSTHDNTTTAKPTAIGAAATLFDASCLATNQPAALAALPALALDQPWALAPNLTAAAALTQTTLVPCRNFSVLGYHFFTNPRMPTPHFSLVGRDGNGPAVSRRSVAAPHTAVRGPSCSHQAGAVAWLYLQATGHTLWRSVYRVNTAGGVAPKSCAGQPREISLPYAAEYWFYS